MADPGTIGSIAPPGEDYLVRRIADLERKVRELGPSIAQSFQSTVDSLVQFGSCGLSNPGITIPTAQGDSNAASGTITVPDGYTRAAVLGIVSVGAWNGSATGDYLYVCAYINGTPGSALPGWADPSRYISVGASAIRTLSGLTPGSSILVGASCWAASGWGASASNIANIDVIAMFGK